MVEGASRFNAALLLQDLDTSVSEYQEILQETAVQQICESDGAKVVKCYQEMLLEVLLRKEDL